MLINSKIYINLHIKHTNNEILPTKSRKYVKAVSFPDCNTFRLATGCPGSGAKPLHGPRMALAPLVHGPCTDGARAMHQFNTAQTAARRSLQAAVEPLKRHARSSQSSFHVGYSEQRMAQTGERRGIQTGQMSNGKITLTYYYYGCLFTASSITPSALYQSFTA
jgi:hypothetical protein